MVAWGDWVGRAAARSSSCSPRAAASRRWRARRAHDEAPASVAARGLPANVAVLPPRGASRRRRAARLRARQPALDGRRDRLGDRVLQASTLVQIRTFAAFFLAPEAAAWCVLLAFGARATIENGALALTRGDGVSSLRSPTSALSSRGACRCRAPASGCGWPRASAGATDSLTPIRRRSRKRSPLPARCSRERAPRPRPPPGTAPARASLYSRSLRAVRRGRLDRPLAKFVVFPLALAIPAFRLHQHIAYGSAFGEYYTFGLAAYLRTFALWWAAWAIGVVLCAAVLRATIEAGTLVAVVVRPDRAIDVRRALESLGLAASLPRPAGVAAAANLRRLSVAGPARRQTSRLASAVT